MANYTSTEWVSMENEGATPWFWAAAQNPEINNANDGNFVNWYIAEFYLIPNPNYTLSITNFNISGVDPPISVNDAGVGSKQWTSGSNPTASIAEYVSGINADNVLPDGIWAVYIFNTTITPYSPQNQVKVTVILAPDFVMPASNKEILIDFDGDAYPYVENNNALSLILTNYIYPQHNPSIFGNSNLQLPEVLTKTYYTSAYEGTYDEDTVVTIGTYPWQLAFSDYGIFSTNPSEVLGDNGTLSGGYGNFDFGFTIPNPSNLNSFPDNFPVCGNCNGMSGWQRDINNYTFFGAPAKWTDIGKLLWNTYERARVQNPNIIDNCTITQVNSLGNSPNEITWTANSSTSNISNMQDIVDISIPATFKITPNNGYTVSAIDFYCLNGSAEIRNFTMDVDGNNQIINSGSYGNYYDDWGSALLGDYEVGEDFTWQWFFKQDSSNDFYDTSTYITGSLYAYYGFNPGFWLTNPETGTNPLNDTILTNTNALKMPNNFYNDLASPDGPLYGQQAFIIQKHPKVLYRMENYEGSTYGLPWGWENTSTSNTVSSFTAQQFLNAPTAAAIWGSTNSPIDQVLFRDSSTPGTPSNEVYIDVYFQENYPMSNYTFETDSLNGGVVEDKNTLYLQINGIARENLGEAKSLVFSFDVGDEKNTGKITVTGNKVGTVESSVRKSGFSDQETIYNISGRVLPNKSTKVGTVKIETTGSSKYFQKAPNLVHDKISKAFGVDINNKIKLIPKSGSDSIIRTNNKVTTYTYDLVYQNNVPTTNIDALKTNIKYKEKEVLTRTLAIEKIDFGKPRINQNGEKRKITIYGKPETPFLLTINKANRYRDYSTSGNTPPGIRTDDAGNPVYPIVNVTQESILSRYNANSNYIDNENNTQASISSKIGSNGKYSFEQSFPKVPLIKSTAINGSMAASGATKIIFDDLAGVEIGDRIMMKEIRSNTMVIVTQLNPDGDNANECTVSSSITAADNAKAYFRRSSAYYLKLKSSASLASNIPTTNPTYVLEQPLNPILTLRATTDSLLYSINSQAIPGSGSQTYDLTYTGAPGSRTDSFKVTYLLDLTSGSKNFALTRIPTFSSDSAIKFHDDGTYRSGSLWTNSVAADNGGTSLNIWCKTTASGANTITITANVTINGWGLNNVIMDLDLDNIVSFS